jgi:nickel/cobalt exporter
MQDAAGVLITAAASTAAVHTLVPDHWLPFVMMGRARKWSLLKASWFAGLSALLHVAASLALGALALGAGMGIASAMGERLHVLTGILLCAFGIAYSVWSWKSGGHRHFHGSGELQADSDNGHSHGAQDGHPVCGDAPRGYRGRDRKAPGDMEKASAYSLVAIVGIHPCVLALPILFASAPLGSVRIGAVAATYAVCTVTAMIVVTIVGLTAARQIRLGFLEKYGDLLTGAIILAVGILTLVHG